MPKIKYLSLFLSYASDQFLAKRKSRYHGLLVCGSSLSFIIILQYSISPVFSTAENRSRVQMDFNNARANFIQNTEFNSQNSTQTRLSDIQASRLKSFKKGAAIAEARIYKAIEYLYYKLDIEKANIATLKNNGFDTSELEQKATNIESSLADIEIKATELKSYYQNIEMLTIDQMKTAIKNAQTLSKSIISNLKNIKAEISALHKAISAF